MRDKPMGELELTMSKAMEENPEDMVDSSQQCLHLAFAALDQLGLDYWKTSPDEIADAIRKLQVPSAAHACRLICPN
jgi:hypothetical protein